MMDEKLARRALKQARKYVTSWEPTQTEPVIRAIDRALASKPKPIEFAAHIDRGNGKRLVVADDKGVEGGEVRAGMSQGEA